MTEYKCGVDSVFGAPTKKQMKRMADLYCMASGYEQPLSALLSGGRKPLPPAGSSVLDAERGGWFPAEDYWPGGRFD